MFYGTGKYTYQLVDNWAKLAEGESFFDVGGICIDKEDRVFVLNRSAHPVMVFDRGGNLLMSWGEGDFNRPHGSCISPEGTIYVVNQRNGTLFEPNTLA